MFETIRQNILAIQSALQTNPKLFLGIFFAGLFLIWLKYRLIGYGVNRAQKQNYAGWQVKAGTGKRSHPTGIGHTEVLIMRPLKVIPIALFCLVFFGGGAAFVASKGLNDPRAWFTVVAGVVFSLLSLWLIAFSFTRIIYDGETIERHALFRAPVTVSLGRLTAVRPISKTIAGGVYLEFQDGERLRVVPRMSGYGQLLEKLARKDPKLALMLRMIDQSQKGA